MKKKFIKTISDYVKEIKLIKEEYNLYIYKYIELREENIKLKYEINKLKDKYENN